MVIALIRRSVSIAFQTGEYGGFLREWQRRLPEEAS